MKLYLVTPDAVTDFALGCLITYLLYDLSSVDEGYECSM